MLARVRPYLEILRPHNMLAAAFAALLSDPRLSDVPMVLETPKGEDLQEDLRNLETLRALAEGRTPRKRRPLATEEWKKGLLAPKKPEPAKKRARARG